MRSRSGEGTSGIGSPKVMPEKKPLRDSGAPRRGGAGSPRDKYLWSSPWTVVKERKGGPTDCIQGVDVGVDPVLVILAIDFVRERGEEEAENVVAHRMREDDRRNPPQLQSRLKSEAAPPSLPKVSACHLNPSPLCHQPIFHTLVCESTGPFPRACEDKGANRRAWR